LRENKYTATSCQILELFFW